eukprot:63511_1
MALKKSDIDCSKFGNDKQCETNDVTKCSCVDRMLTGLAYYQQCGQDTEQLIPLIKKEWQHFLDDNVHITTAHGDQLYKLYQLYVDKYDEKPCDIQLCKCVNRNYRTYRDTDSGKHDFCQMILDAMHCYINHTFESGLRVPPERNEDEIKTAVENSDIEFNQNRFHNVFERIDSTNKFTLKTGFLNDTKISRTPIDDLCKFVFNGKTNEFLASEEYDTESVLEDIIGCSSVQSSNILQQTQNETVRRTISDYMRCYKLNSISFSAGFVFWYWPYYGKDENQTSIQSNLVTWMNADDFGGYTRQELYIARGKYADFKSEILGYETNAIVHVTMDQYNEMLGSAEQYMETTYCKKILARKPGIFAMRHYDIDENEQLKLHHLISILLYCNKTKLCTAFSSTFRKLHFFETISEVKQRNQQYYFMAKFLREVVDIFGSSGYVFDSVTNESISEELGPFFTGMSTVMIMPSFSIYLYGPTSTTKQYEVARYFAGDKGTVIQLNNKYFAGGRYQRFFYTGWISNYKSEDERLTFGGSYPMQIQGIRLLKTKQCYNVFFEPLFRFDAIVSGLDLDFDWNKQYITIIKKFIIYANDPTQPSPFDQYITDTFVGYLHNKQSLSFNLASIDGFVPDELKNLMFYSVHGVRDRKQTVYVDKGDNTNLPRAEILNIFVNLRHVIIHTVDERGKTTYQISLPQLVTKVKNAKCMIVGVWKDWEGRKDKRQSWLSFIQIPSDIKSSLTSQMDYDDVYSDVLSIHSKIISN